MGFYTGLLRPLLFLGDAEKMHDRAIRAAAWCSAHPGVLSVMERFHAKPDPILKTHVADLEFSSPLGLAAGYDKNGRGVPLWAAMGFGHVEIGSISAEFSAGNPKPRLFRIPVDEGIVVYYGLPNVGAEAVARTLSRVHRAVPLGINIVNTNRGPSAQPESDGAIISDYVHSVRTLEPHADYLALNLSCPNTADGRAFISDSCRIQSLIQAVGDLKPVKPVFLKVAPFAAVDQMEAFLRTVEGATWVTGFSTNLPPGKPAGLSTPESELARMPGAVSGMPSHARALQTVRDLRARIDLKRYSLIASGGVSSAEDAYAFIRAGASLVQLATALIYQGPSIVPRISEGLANLLRRDGFSSVSAAVGASAGSGEGPVK